MSTDYRYDQIQKRYFVIDDLFVIDQIRHTDIIALAEQISGGEDQKDFLVC